MRRSLTHAGQSVERRSFRSFYKTVKSLDGLKLGHHFVEETVGSGSGQIENDALCLRVFDKRENMILPSFQNNISFFCFFIQAKSTSLHFLRMAAAPAAPSPILLSDIV